MGTCARCAINRACPISWTMEIMAGMQWDCPHFEDPAMIIDHRAAERAIKDAKKYSRQKAKGNR